MKPEINTEMHLHLQGPEAAETVQTAETQAVAPAATCSSFDWIRGQQEKMKRAEWVVQAHQCKRGHFEARVVDPEHFAYVSGNHPLQVCITASGWRARLIRWVLRIPPCNFTGTPVRYWPHDDLIGTNTEVCQPDNNQKTL